MAMECEFDRLKFLSPSEVERVHEASLRTLEKVGLIVEEPRLLQRFADAGARVDLGARRVRITPALVDAALSVAPKVVLLAGRDPSNDMLIGSPEQVCPSFMAGVAANYIYDPQRREHRLATRMDLADLVRIVEALPNTNGLVAPILPCDVDPRIQSEEICAEVLRNTTKHFTSVNFGQESARRTLEVASIVAGGLDRLAERPIVSVTVNPISPLMLDRNQCENLLEFAAAGLPITFGSAAVGGTTAPITIAGTVALANSETLAAVVATQIMKSGSPIILHTSTTCMDLRTGAYQSGAIERVLLSCCHIQMARSYGLPAAAATGISDSKVTDEQTAYEKTFNLFAAALAGVHLLRGGGAFDNLFVHSHEQLVIDDEIMAMIRRIMRGVDTSPDSFAAEIVEQVGPRGQFLDSLHTLVHMRREVSVSQLSTRLSRSQWEEEGSKDVVERARDKVRAILAGSPASLLPADVETTLATYQADLRRWAAGQ